MSTFIPAEFSITELATVLGVSRRVIEYRVSQGVLPSVRYSKSARGKKVIPTAALKEHHPEIWDAIVLKKHVVDSLDDD